MDDSQFPAELMATSSYSLFSFFSLLQIIRGLLKYWPKTCTQKEVRELRQGNTWTILKVYPDLQKKKKKILCLLRWCSWGRSRRSWTWLNPLSSSGSRSRSSKRSQPVSPALISRSAPLHVFICFKLLLIYTHCLTPLRFVFQKWNEMTHKFTY